MTILQIRTYPDPILRRECDPITEFDEQLRSLVMDMAETMYANYGMGLAAPQVGVALQLFVMDVSPEDKVGEAFEVFINTDISSQSGKTGVVEEGCLSFPGVIEPISRPIEVHGTAQDEHGERRKFEWKDIRAVAALHEWEHTHGILMIDHLSRKKRRAIDRKMKLLKRRKR